MFRGSYPTWARHRLLGHALDVLYLHCVQSRIQHFDYSDGEARVSSHEFYGIEG